MACLPTGFLSLFHSLCLALPEVTFRKTTCKQAFDSDFACVHAKSLQLCPALCDTMEYGPQGSSVHGILQAGRLEWVAMPSSRGDATFRESQAQMH